MHALIAKRESQSTLILIYVSQTSTEMEQSGIEVGVRAMKKKKEEPDAACSKLTPLFSLRLILKIFRYTHM